MNGKFILEMRSIMTKSTEIFFMWNNNGFSWERRDPRIFQMAVLPSSIENYSNFAQNEKFSSRRFTQLKFYVIPHPHLNNVIVNTVGRYTIDIILKNLCIPIKKVFMWHIVV